MDNWREGLTRDDLFDALNELFYRDLESWFDSSIFYCDSCVEDFIKKWPGIYSWDEDFQRNSIQLDVFYEGSRLGEFFSKEEFIDLFKDIKCPNCGGRVSGNIWPYDMSFDVPDNFEEYIDEIAILADETPFLLLSHPFAKEVYNEIKALSKTITTSKLSRPLFRARVYKKGTIYNEGDFLSPNKKDIKEGRYNHAGRKVLYLAEDEPTCYFEMRAPKEGIMLAKVKIPEHLKILDLLDKGLEGNSIIQAIKLSSLLSSPDEGEGWYKPHYVFTRFVADVAKSVGFEAIRYPSVRLNQGNNTVVLDYEKIKDKTKIIDFIYVTEDKINSNTINLWRQN
ncbi:RES family NAD+ phosphorylase [Bacillus cereus]|nr:RES family NAD+ phosphorylase [Bacillus cereus]